MENITLYGEALIPQPTEIWQSDEYLSFVEDNLLNPVEKVVVADNEALHGAVGRVVFIADSEEAAKTLLKNRLDELLAEHQGYSIVQMICTFKPVNTDLAIIFVGTLAKNPSILS